MSSNLVEVNCVGLQCPAPILTISKVAKSATRPAVLEVRSDDGDFALDVRAWCRSTGAVLESLQETDGTFVARIALGTEDAPQPSPKLPSRAPTPGPLPPRTSAPHRAAPSAPPTYRTAPPAPPAPPRATRSGPERIELDCRGLICPAPILRLSRAAREAAGPTQLVVTATDDAFPGDVEAWCHSAGATLRSLVETPEGFVATVEVHNPSPAPPPPTPRTGPDGAGPRAHEIDLRGQKPELGLLDLGQRVLDRETVSFVADSGPLERHLRAWADAIGASLDLVGDGPALRGTVQLSRTPGSRTPSPAPAAPDTSVPRKNKAALLVLRNDFESLMAAMMCANASAAQGMEVDVYFAFWGVNVLRAPRPGPTAALARISPVRRLMKWMMPAGPEAQPMSKMNFGGFGLQVMKGFMREQNILGLRALMNEAAELDVRFVVCTMSMGIMGIDKADLMALPNLSFGGVASFASAARESAMSLVF